MDTRYFCVYFIGIYRSTESVLLVSQGLSDLKNAMGTSKETFHRHEKANVLMSNTENNISIEEKIDSVFKERVEKKKKRFYFQSWT